MSRDKTISHEKIVKAAREEFGENGYDRGSMRRIGERCGLTAAALYRHFDSKEKMFEALVEPAVEKMQQWIDVHNAESDMKAAEGGGSAADDPEMIWLHTEIEMMKELIYPNMDDYSMLINKSRGSKYESFLEDMVDDHQKKMSEHLRSLKGQGHKVNGVSDEEIRILMRAYCIALFEPVTRGYGIEESIKYVDTVETFFMSGWKTVTGLE